MTDDTFDLIDRLIRTADLVDQDSAPEPSPDDVATLSAALDVLDGLAV